LTSVVCRPEDAARRGLRGGEGSSKKARDAETPDPLAIGVVSFRMGATVRVPRLMTVSLPSPAEIPSAVAWDAAFPKESPARLRLPFSALALEVALTVTDPSLTIVSSPEPVLMPRNGPACAARAVDTDRAVTPVKCSALERR
jgi:hypothetical protein